MKTVLVHVQVKPDFVESFIRATLDNVSNSRKEPGVLRFEFMQDKRNPTNFVLIEMYRDDKDHNQHRSTRHYNVWRNTVGSMMEEPRHSIEYELIEPESRQEVS